MHQELYRQPPRYHHRFIDLMRGIAVIGMVATHTTDAFLADSWKHTTLWYGIHVLFGFVAPAFLFYSGVTLWGAVSRRLDATNSQGQTTGLLRLVRRGCTILLLGYWLQIPALSLYRLITSPSANELHRLFDSNILQIIALALLLITGCAFLLRSARSLRILAGMLFAMVLIATPYVWHSQVYQSLPQALQLYLAPQPIASFPLTPYLAYILAGFISADYLIRLKESGNHLFIPLLSGIGLISLSFLLDIPLSTIQPHHDFWNGSIQIVFFRLGGLAIATGLCMELARHLPIERSWVEYAGTKSLGIYILHLMLIYGSPVSMGMRFWVHGALNGTMTPVAVALLTILITGICWYAVYTWDQLRIGYPALSTWLKRLWWIGFWIAFLWP